MKRHYTRTLTGFKCPLCRQEFDNREDYAKHCKRGGKCKHPVAMGLAINLTVSVVAWRRAA
ncbi:hypothetical protein OHA28_30780 [Streptomyces sp. NBC_00269]|uniref:hypothetical protein n=1 Tax=Streptomyces sp. NBC_00269 TaxID=2975696 RepID=UPI002E2A4DFA|nr:hypothetical protein [Streptomyces sp. NBC_00269]